MEGASCVSLLLSDVDLVIAVQSSILLLEHIRCPSACKAEPYKHSIDTSGSVQTQLVTCQSTVQSCVQSRVHQPKLFIRVSGKYIYIHQQLTTTDCTLILYSITDFE